jgi:hypothetical protein
MLTDNLCFESSYLVGSTATGGEVLYYLKSSIRSIIPNNSGRKLVKVADYL